MEMHNIAQTNPYPYRTFTKRDRSSRTRILISPSPDGLFGSTLAQLTRYSVSLLERTSESMPSGGAPSALGWILKRIDDRLVRIFTGDLPPFEPIDCLIYCAISKEKCHMPALDTLPFPLTHTDLSKMNVLVDDDFNITGILDWDEWAYRLPLQCAVMYPAIIAVDPSPLQDSALFHDDRLSFMNHFASAVASSTSSGLRDFDLYLQSILANDELQMFHASIKSKGVYTLWVSKYAVRDARWAPAARKALDQFVLARPQMALESRRPISYCIVMIIKMTDRDYLATEK